MYFVGKGIDLYLKYLVSNNWCCYILLLLSYKIVYIFVHSYFIVCSSVDVVVFFFCHPPLSPFFFYFNSVAVIVNILLDKLTFYFSVYNCRFLCCSAQYLFYYYAFLIKVHMTNYNSYGK